jgi:hypothetical protein
MLTRKLDQRANRKKVIDCYVRPRRITENDLDAATFGPEMGMGMGMGPPTGWIAQPVDSTYSALGGSLLDRHQWKQHVYLAEFLKYLSSDPARFATLKTAIDGVALNSTRVDPVSTDTPSSITPLTMHAYDDGLIEAKNHKEIQALHEFEAAADNERLSDIMAESADYVPLFENLCYFDGHSHPKTYQLVQTMVLVGFTLAMYFKQTYRRKRPSVVDPTLDPAIKVPTFWAFPSGHSTQVHLIKNALTGSVSNFSEPLEAGIAELADEIAINREFAGVHYYSDTLAGAALADAIWQQFGDMLDDANSNESNYIIEDIRVSVAAEWA